MVDNVRCPTCGKLNPANSTVCQYCHSQIKPASFSSQPADSESDASADPDWLSELRDDSPPAFSPLSSESSEEIPDWLSRIQNQASGDTPSQGDPVGDILGDHPVPPSAASTPPAQPSSAQPSDEMDWLSRLDDAPLSSEPTGDGQESLSGSQADTPPSQDESSGADDWMRSLTDWGMPSSSILPDAGSASSQGELPQEPAALQPNGEMDWLRSFESNQLPPEEPSTPAPFSADSLAPMGNDDLPDWLRGMQSATPAPTDEDQPAPQDIPSSAQTPDLPDWLNDFQGQTQPAADDLPDWLAPVAGADAFQTDQPNQTFLEETPPAESPAAEVSPFTDAAADLPNWLQSANVSSEPSQWASPFASDVPPPESDNPPSETQPAESAQPFVSDDLPDWMTDFDQKQAVPAGFSAPSSFAQEDQPPSNQPFDVDLPDWLSEEAEPESTAQGLTSADATQQPAQALSEENHLETAELPAWVQAMRPIEVVMPDEADASIVEAQTEKTGPLAGVRGVLPLEESAFQYNKPPIYSVKLRLSEKQRSNASLLEAVLANETTPVKLTSSQSHAPRAIQRLIVSIFLLFTLFVVLVSASSDFKISVPPQLYPPELTSFSQQVENLPANAPVLVAFDYEPGLSGEMRFASIMVLDHLMRKQSRIAIISTIPTGPALADQLIREAASLNSGYDVTANVENLGYLPGGTISLLEFANNPKQAAPQSFLNAHPWDGNALSGITTIQDFQRVIVLTDQAEVGRAWVEQVQPTLGQVPLLMVASAQASPMLQPYVQSHQVQGLISGQMGGVLYGQINARQDHNIGRVYWGAYQIGLLLVFLFVLVGSIFSGVVAILHRTQKGETHES